MSTSYPIVNHLIDRFASWLEHRREIRELRGLDSGEFDSIARELSVTPADLDTFVRQGPHAADELPKLLRALGIDQDDLSRTKPLMLRDMARVCAACQQKARCSRDLNTGMSTQHYDEYCLNGPTIDALGHKR
ncbi:MAG TPA: hypothetical protein VG168_15820, partial [Bryobacteraceae bacterium]|nr:hypothetical protein [Bryobacteraceae bacterium]